PAAAVSESGAVDIYIKDTSNYCRDHRIHRVTADWSEGGLTHNNQPGYDQGQGQICSNGSAGYRSFSVSTGQIDQQRTSSRFGWTVRDVGGNILSSYAYYQPKEGNSSQAARL